jgi:hypothetical protein
MMRLKRRKRGPCLLSVEQMVEKYQAGLGLDDIGHLADISSSTVKDRLLKAGVTLRPRGGQPGKPNSYMIHRKRK